MTTQPKSVRFNTISVTFFLIWKQKIALQTQSDFLYYIISVRARKSGKKAYEPDCFSDVFSVVFIVCGKLPFCPVSAQKRHDDKHNSDGYVAAEADVTVISGKRIAAVFENYI